MALRKRTRVLGRHALGFVGQGKLALGFLGVILARVGNLGLVRVSSLRLDFK